MSNKSSILPLIFSVAAVIFGVAMHCRAEVLPPQWVSSSPRINAVQWRSNGQPVSWPVTDLSGSRPLTLSFDIIESMGDDLDNTPWLRGRLEHRDANWKKENIADNEFIRHFNVAEIGQGEPSIGGITTLYRHFEVEMPPRDIDPYISGNYLFHIYADSNPDSILLTVPFMIEENSASINGNVAVVTDIDYKSKHQQLALEVTPVSIDNRIRPQEFIVFAGQNNAAPTWRNLGFPTRIADNKAIFQHKNELIFQAGNEYRRMEVIENTVPMLHVDHIEWHDPFCHQVLQTDSRRNGSHYLYDYNNVGKFFVREYSSVDPDYEADYCVVHFTLDGEGIPENSAIYVEGDFTGRSFSPYALMSWDPMENIYYKSMLLKQGAYDYKYLTPKSPEGLFSVEGNYHETGNEYNVAVYYRIPGERYDRLAATTTLSTY